MSYVFRTEAQRFFAAVTVSEAEARHASMTAAIARAKDDCADTTVRTAIAKYAKVENPTPMRPNIKVSIDVYILTVDQMSKLVDDVYTSAMRDAVKFSGSSS